jgi:hypothetical protein
VPDRSLVVHLAPPPWAHPRDEEQFVVGVLAPTLDLLADAPAPVGLVLGGRLAERLVELDADRFAALRDRIAEGGVVLVGTPLHAPALGAIPARDAIGQLRMHITLQKRVFGVRPRGCWLPGPHWDPTLPRILRKAGLAWTLLDDRWLEAVGAPRARVLSVERDGHAVAVLRSGPVVQCLQPLEPADVAEVERALPSVTCSPVTLLDRPRARAYLPSGGPAGLWETRLLDDAGADALHKRMQRVSRQVERLRRAVEATAHADVGPDPMRLEQVVRYLYRAQSGVAYGGPLCATAHRDRAWHDLLRAERILDDELDGPLPCCVLADLDADGADEVRLRSDGWSVTVAPAAGGTLTELSRRDDAVNALAGVLPLAFRETFDDGRVAADRWELVTTETPGDGLARAVLVADSQLTDSPVRLTKGVQVGPTGPLRLRIEVANRGMDPARGRLSTELFLALGGRRWSDDQSEPMTVELGGGREPLDEVVRLPPVEAVGLAGWRSRVDLEMRPPAGVLVEPLADGLARLELSWPVELFARDRARREVMVSLREVPNG